MGNPRTIDIGGGRWVLALVFLEDGRHILSGGFEGVIRHWRIDDGSQVGDGIQASSHVRALALSQDSRWIVSGENGVATVWDRSTRRMAMRVKHTGWVDTVDVSPDSRRFATGSRENNVFIWNVLTGGQLGGPLVHDGPLAGVKFSPDGSRLATATWGLPSLRIYNTGTGSLIRTVSVTSFTTTPISWTSDSQSIFAISFTSIRRIDINREPPQWPAPGNIPGTYASVTLSSNGRFVASFAGRSISLWDASSREQIGTVIEHTARVWSIALSLDNLILATGDENGIITLRNLSDVIPSSYLVGVSIGQPLQNLLTSTLSGPCRIRSNLTGVYLARQDQPNEVVTQPSDQSSVSQRWTVSPTRLNDGTYRIEASNGNALSVGNANHLVCDSGRIRTTWTIEPRGSTYVIGNVANTMVIHLVQQNQRVSVSPRNNSPNQRWVLERV